MSAWRKSDVTNVQILPLIKLSPLKAMYSSTNSGSESQETRETRMQTIITRLIFLNFDTYPEVSKTFLQDLSNVFPIHQQAQFELGK